MKTRTLARLSFVALIAGSSQIVLAQAAAPGPTDSTAPAAAPGDVSSMDAILKALYGVISGPAGPRDWNRFRSLFIDGARLIPTRHDSTGHYTTTVWSPADYAARAGSMFMQRPFFENEVSHTVDTFGAITQVFSTYASRTTPDGEPFARGINSIQLFNDGKRWYVVTIFWDAERKDNPIPAKYLAK